MILIDKLIKWRMKVMFKDLLKNNPTILTTAIAFFDRMGAKMVLALVTNGGIGYLLYKGFFVASVEKIAALLAMVAVFGVFAVYRDKEDERKCELVEEEIEE